jgi:hypothetical protein
MLVFCATHEYHGKSLSQCMGYNSQFSTDYFISLTYAMMNFQGTHTKIAFLYEVSFWTRLYWFVNGQL